MGHRSPIAAMRQHHGIEHATVTLLSQRLPSVQLVARSDLQGFTVLGEVSAPVLRATVEEALARLQAGEVSLAIHPNCGTNLVTAGVMSGLASLVFAGGKNRSWVDRLPSAILGATLALIVALPMGRWMQQNVTTSGDVAGLRVSDVTPLLGGPVPGNRVTIQ